MIAIAGVSAKAGVTLGGGRRRCNHRSRGVVVVLMVGARVFLS